ncbi:hypothetical protein R3W88_012181 [Solanum pinnatisectum]|uniref:RNase H type-1 domain-containing protein n=1 Tax=Solanum pinnatisectum TaxID=50273 RepID=A0AAV9L9L3_9SOLN|nr:hypothetical protein R3W88_012181 [Solanum pinnatisectum]
MLSFRTEYFSFVVQVEEAFSKIMAYSDYFGDCTNNVFESNSILTGIQGCITNGYTNVDIESYSMIIFNMINDHSNWNGNYKFRHCYREVNSLADYLANMGEKQRKYSFFKHNLTLPNEVKN